MNSRIAKETKLYIVVPCYNEEEVILSTISQLSEKLSQLINKELVSSLSRIIFVNDGSKDATSELIQEACHNNNSLCLINFSRNYGHQNAILAGMLMSMNHCDAVITIDADLQQDIEAIDLFLEEYLDGCDIVYGVRNSRKTDGIFKKITALSYYKLMKILGCDVKANSADYRLMSNKALNALSQFQESNLFLRGLIPLMGFKSGIVNFDVKDRTAGQSKYTFKKMMTLALDGITSLSIKPIHMITYIGFFMFIISLFMIIFSLVEWAQGNNIVGYSTTVISIWMVGGLVLLSQGILGEYIGKMYFETKKRPRYVIDSVVWPDESQL